MAVLDARAAPSLLLACSLARSPLCLRPPTHPPCSNVFYRERAAGMYTALPMAVAQGNVEIPYLLAQTVVYS